MQLTTLKVGKKNEEDADCVRGNLQMKYVIAHVHIVLLVNFDSYFIMSFTMKKSKHFIIIMNSDYNKLEDGKTLRKTLLKDSCIHRDSSSSSSSSSSSTSPFPYAPILIGIDAT